MEIQNAIIPRDNYLNQLVDGMHNHMIKIVTGIRRSGKSFLLSRIFVEYLHKNGVDDEHILNIALDEFEFRELRKPENIHSYIIGRIKDLQMYYILIDEVQMLTDFVDILNSLLHKDNVDVYVTGSNSKFLSKDVATEFRGRGDEIHIYPFSFSEYYNAIQGDKSERWKEYLRYGGLPQLLSLPRERKKSDFLKQICQTVYVKDLIERCKIKNVVEFQELMMTISSSIGTPCNPTKLSNTFKSVKGISIDPKTISNYLSYMEDAFLIEKAMRYDIKGKKYIGSLSKYYFQDIGLRNALLDFRQIEESHIMENVIYNELRNRGYRVDVGFVEVWTRSNDKRHRKQLEVDFVAEQGPNRYYIQSALEMTTQEKKEQEKASLKNIDDGFKRIIIVRSDMAPYYDENGYLIAGLYDFLLNAGFFNEL